MSDNADEYIKKWQEQIRDQDVLQRVISNRFIEIFQNKKHINEFDEEIF